MKHDLSPAAAQPVIAANSGTALALTLHLIESLGADGKPRLAGCEGMTVLCPVNFTDDVLGSFAVCVGVNEATIMVLGHLPVTAIATALAGTAPANPAEPLTLRRGRSQLQLHPDGRIRISGDDVIIESNGRMGLKGAIIDLN